MAYINKNDKIFVAGHKGLVGSSIYQNLSEKGYNNLLVKDRSQLDLLDEVAVKNFFEKESIDVVFVAAAKVGGIHANNTYRADFIYENLQVQNNVIWNAHKHGVRRLIFLGSSCIYPRQCPQPMRENSLLTGHLEYTNRPYAIAKIAGLELIGALRRQYNRDYFSVMPTNLYGPRDNFHPENSHVLPALIRKIATAKNRNHKEVVVWGTGKPKREFMFAQDCADAIVFLAEKLDSTTFKKACFEDEDWSHINIGTGEEVSIRKVTELLAQVSNFEGEIIFDTSKPDGTVRKLMDSSILRDMGWSPSMNLYNGLKETYDWFCNNY